MKIRVRHEPSSCKYVIETKKGRFSDWTYTSCSYYSLNPEKENATFPGIEDAKERAIKAARYLLEDAIVWEGEA